VSASSPPLLARQAFGWRLLFPVRPQIAADYFFVLCNSSIARWSALACAWLMLLATPVQFSPISDKSAKTERRAGSRGKARWRRSSGRRRSSCARPRCSLSAPLANENTKRAPWYARHPVCPPFPVSNPVAPASQSSVSYIISYWRERRASTGHLLRLTWSLCPEFENESPDLDVCLRRPFWYLVFRARCYRRVTS
jgi:hypothetical protein